MLVFKGVPFLPFSVSHSNMFYEPGFGEKAELCLPTMKQISQPAPLVMYNFRQTLLFEQGM